VRLQLSVHSCLMLCGYLDGKSRNYKKIIKSFALSLFSNPQRTDFFIWPIASPIYLNHSIDGGHQIELLRSWVQTKISGLYQEKTLDYAGK
jgi:hypothetical protein